MLREIHEVTAREDFVYNLDMSLIEKEIIETYLLVLTSIILQVEIQRKDPLTFDKEKFNS